MTGANIIAIGDLRPVIAPSAFIAPGCQIIGDVVIGEEASIWYNCVIRAEVNQVRIGARTNIQDGTVVHCDGPQGDHPGYPTIIGDDCLIGHNAIIHGCMLQDHAFIGMGSIALNGAVIESDGMLGAGAMLTAGKRILSGQLWVGWPAKYLRDLRPEEITSNRAGVDHYVKNGQAHKAAVRI